MQRADDVFNDFCELSSGQLTIAIRLATAQPAGSRYTAEHLTRPNGFAGVDGAFRFRPDGTSQHSLAVLEVQQFNPTVIDPAPPGFAPGETVTTGALRN